VENVEGVDRNFYFTTEARYLMVYRGGETLRFYGDDDVWVFINGILAVDLGGTHMQLAGSITLDTGGSDPRFDLEAGNAYEIVVFHADRHPRDSNYELTLSGFATDLSVCGPECGDGVATLMEECDQGVDNNDEAYGGCRTDCTFGPFCGDGVINGPELCDDGINSNLVYGSTDCAPGCVFPPRCGDAVVDPGEECDDGDGVNNENTEGGCSTQCTINPRCGDGVAMAERGEECDYGADNAPPDQVTYGGCTTECKLGPYCGDGHVDFPEELCDDGNQESNDGCSSICLDETIK
jgi:fibro-slime domain-containing protein